MDKMPREIENLCDVLLTSQWEKSIEPTPKFKADWPQEMWHDIMTTIKDAGCKVSRIDGKVAAEAARLLSAIPGGVAIFDKLSKGQKTISFQISALSVDTGLMTNFSVVIFAQDDEFVDAVAVQRGDTLPTAPRSSLH